MEDVFSGVIIEESLADKSVLKKLNILNTKVSIVNEKHKTPWVKQWTLHTIKIPAAKAASVAIEISHLIDPKHSHAWYVDFKDNKQHYIIFLNKVFLINVRNQEEYDSAREYGISIGIPEYQLNFKATI